MAAAILTHARLRELLHYDPDTGVFSWRASGKGRPAPGIPAGSVHGNGYRSINIEHRYYSAHRLAFFYVTGQLPPQDMRVDHINGLRDDNRWSNIRQVTNSQNMQNQKRPMRTNRSGLLGVSPAPKGKFRASIFLNGRTTQLGTFSRAEDAHEAYLKAKRQIHPAGTL